MLNFKKKFQFCFNFKLLNSNIPFVWTVTGNTYKKCGWKRAISVEDAGFRESYFQKKKCTNKPKMTLNITRSKVSHINMSHCTPRVPNFTSFRPTTRNFQYSCNFSFTHLPQCQIAILLHFLNLNSKITRSNFGVDSRWSVWLTKIISLQEPAFWESYFREKNHKCTEWPQNDLEYYKAKGWTTVYESQISLRFALYRSFCR